MELQCESSQKTQSAGSHQAFLFLPSTAPLPVVHGIWSTGPMCFGNQFIVRKTGAERDHHGHGGQSTVTGNHTTDATASNTMH